MSVEGLSVYETVNPSRSESRTSKRTLFTMISAFVRRTAAKCWDCLEMRLAGESDYAIANIVTGQQRSEIDKARERALINYQIGFAPI